MADCGDRFYCSHCTALSEAIGRAWHVQCAEIVASAQLVEAEMRMRLPCTATAWPRPEEIHVCSDGCGHYSDDLPCMVTRRHGLEPDA